MSNYESALEHHRKVSEDLQRALEDWKLIATRRGERLASADLEASSMRQGLEAYVAYAEAIIADNDHDEDGAEWRLLHQNAKKLLDGERMFTL